MKLGEIQTTILRNEVRSKMAKIDLSKYGISGTTEVVYNTS